MIIKRILCSIEESPLGVFKKKEKNDSHPTIERKTKQKKKISINVGLIKKKK